MKVELAKAFKGATKKEVGRNEDGSPKIETVSVTWPRGEVFDDTEAPFPPDIQQALKDKDPAVRIIPVYPDHAAGTPENVKKLEQELAQEAHKADRLTGDLAEARQELDEANKVIEPLREEIAKLKDQLEKLQKNAAEFDVLKKRNGELETENKDLDTMLKNERKNIAELKKELKALKDK